MSKDSNNNLKYALCYIPLVSFIIIFIEEKKDEELKKHIKRSLILFLIYIVLSTIIWYISFFLSWLIALAYIVISIILGFKTYNWDKSDIKILNEIEEKIKDTFK